MKKKLLASLMCVVMAVSLISGSAFAVEYSDAQSHWASESIARWSDYGIVDGVGNGQFNPNGEMTRAQAAMVFSRLLGLTEKADISAYTDVADTWYTDAIAQCVSRGILNGTGTNTMSPNGKLTREQMFTMLCRALGIAPEATTTATHEDLDQVSGWAQGYVNALLNKGYVKGTSGNKVAPKVEINRASVMSLLDQTISVYAVEDGATVTVDKAGVVLIKADNVTVTGTADATVVVANAEATVSLKGYTGTAEVVALQDNVAVTDAPTGTTVTSANGATGTTANGNAVTPDSSVVIEAPKPSVGGGIVIPAKPVVTVGGIDYTWDADAQEYISENGTIVDKAEMAEILQGAAAVDPSERIPINVDGKDYVYDADKQEWIHTDADEKEHVLTTDQIAGGTLTSQPLPGSNP